MPPGNRWRGPSRATARAATRRRDGGALSCVNPFAPACGRPEIVNLTAEYGRGEASSPIDRRSFPQQKALHRRLGVPGVAMRTRRIAEPVAGAGDGIDDARSELPAGI